MCMMAEFANSICSFPSFSYRTLPLVLLPPRIFWHNLNLSLISEHLAQERTFLTFFSKTVDLSIALSYIALKAWSHLFVTPLGSDVAKARHREYNDAREVN